MKMKIKKNELLLKKEKEVFDIIAETAGQYEYYLKIISIADIAESAEAKKYPVHDWNTPLDLTLSSGEKHAFME